MYLYSQSPKSNLHVFYHCIINSTAAIEDRLLDFDDKVRIQAVIVACDLTGSNLKYTSSKLISEVIERLRDKKVILL